MTPADRRQRRPEMREWIERNRRLMILGVVIAAIILIGRVSPYEPVRETFDVFGWVTETAVDITRHMFENYGELTVFLAPMLENTLFIGALIPGSLVMILAGVATQNGILELYVTIPLAIIGAIIGDTVSYWIGRFSWQRLGPESRIVKWSETIREPLMNHSVWLILSYHFAGYSRLVGPASAGFLRVPFLRWALLDYIGVTLWVVAFITAGYALAAGLDLDIKDPSERDIQAFELILFALLVTGVFLILRRAGKERAAQAAQEEDVTTVAEAPTLSPDGARPAPALALDPADPPADEKPERVG